MRCRHCGTVLADDELICPKCGTEVQIVPDYNPLEDVLAREVRGSVEDATRPIGAREVRRYRKEETATEYGDSTRVLSQGELDRIRGNQRAPYQSRVPGEALGGSRGSTGQRTGNLRRDIGGARQTTGNLRRDTGGARQTTGNLRRDTGGVRQNTGNLRSDTGSVRQNTGNLRTNTGSIPRSPEARRRQQQARRKQAAKRRAQKVLIVFLILLILMGAAGFFLYRNSYPGVVKQGYSALATGDYGTAESRFNRAIGKSPGKPEAYVGLSKVFIQQDDLEAAEEVFLSALEGQPSNSDIYEAAIAFYTDTEQPEKIAELLQGCEDEGVLKKVADYLSPEPEFTPDDGTYDEVQQVSLHAEGSTIYYTTDGSDPLSGAEPSSTSTQYTEPILLSEGTTQIKAAGVNKKGIPSVTVTKEYTVDVPVADAPSVNPSTGTYNTATQITVTVPEGYTAYYTMDGTDPTTSSTQYTAPIDMPEVEVGEWTTFKAILVNNNNGKTTQITTKRYSLNPS